MKLPVIKHLVKFAQQNDEDYIIEAIEVIEHLGAAKGIKEQELEVLSEALSNMYGSLEVYQQIKEGVPEKEALNQFMKRVMGAINP